MKEALCKLLKVKSLVTVMLTIVFCILAITGVITSEQFMTVFTVIIGFYFGSNIQKKVDENGTNN